VSTTPFDIREPGPRTDPSELNTRYLLRCALGLNREDAPPWSFCGHHGSPDGSLPSPAIPASVLAARTRQVAIVVAAAVLPFLDPVRLVEDLNIVDIISEE
jgi:hypothetical protein